MARVANLRDVVARSCSEADDEGSEVAEATTAARDARARGRVRGGPRAARSRPGGTLKVAIVRRRVGVWRKPIPRSRQVSICWNALRKVGLCAGIAENEPGRQLRRFRSPR